jgi:hypothetical protein
MSNFSLNSGMVRGDLFTIREAGGGKWKYTVQIDMSEHWDDVDIHKAVIDAFRETPSQVRGVVDNISGYQLVVLEPFHKNSYPVCVAI